jgi:hypothetical protein
MARNQYDYYPTPYWCFEKLPIDWDIFKTAIEPCEGDGRITKFLQEVGIDTKGIDLKNGINYLTTEYQKVDLILTNPPYTLAKEFIEKAITEAKTVIMLLRINFLGSQKRHAWWVENEPTALYVLSKRPSFTGTGTDSTEYAWYVWDTTNKLNKGIYHVL